MSPARDLLEKFAAELREEIRAELRAEIMAELSTTMATPQGRRWIDLTAVAAKLGCSTRQVHRYRVDGNFPIPRKRLGGAPAWFEDEIDAWMSACAALPY